MTRQILDRSKLQGESIELFRAAIKSPYTRDPYERRLTNFLNYVDLSPDEFVALGRKDPTSIEKKVIAFIATQKARVEKGEITGATISNFLKAVRLLLEMNDVSLNWKKIRRILPRSRRYAVDRIPTLEEIRSILDVADLRGKALTLLFLSSGVREGSIEYFQVQDYSVIERDDKIAAGRLIVYRGEPEMYVVFITAEAVNALDKYIQFRKDHGEVIHRTSPLFRDKFDPIKGQYGHGKQHSKVKIIPMTPPAVRQYYNRLLFSIGIRSEKKRRHDFSVHGFRKWFKTRCEIGGMKPVNVETLLNHSTGISDSYYRPLESELFEEYLAVVEQHLSVSTENKLKTELEELRNIDKDREKMANATMNQISKELFEMGQRQLKLEQELEEWRRQKQKPDRSTTYQIQGVQ
jgi:integrase